jgi:indolepyruvate ferredoxin oxidoreductase
MCATEKRRKRKRSLLDDPAWRVIINPEVCEGCGDCGSASNCLSVVPIETEFGRKRAIDQSACNKDYSCLKGFCPSFVLVKGGTPRKAQAADNTEAPFAALPEPTLPGCATPYGILITGVGGMGIVTLGALLGMAARLEGKGATVLDKIGLAQKFGAVTGHVRIAERQDSLHAVRIASGGAKLLLGGDLVVSANPDSLGRLSHGDCLAVINSHQTVTGDFTRDPDLAFPDAEMRRLIADAAGQDAVDFIDATRMATALIGDAVAANLFMLGFAYQKGRVPVSADALERAVEINGVAVDANKRAFRWGRLAAHEPTAVAQAVDKVAAVRPEKLSESLDELIERRTADLTRYQNATYAARFAALVERVRRAEAERAPELAGLAETVARAYHKLLAYKDEYEVARLYTDGRFHQRIDDRFEGDYSLSFSLAPPLFAGRDPQTGHLKKHIYGPWVLPTFRLMAGLKWLRGTPLDPFGHSAERRQERQLIADYEATVAELVGTLKRNNHALAVEIARLPLKIRGFGHVKSAAIERVQAEQAELLQCLRNPAHRAEAAE